MFKLTTIRTSARPLSGLARTAPGPTALNAPWRRPFSWRADSGAMTQLWRTWAENSAQRMARRPRLGSALPGSELHRIPRRGFRSSSWRRSGADNAKGQSQAGGDKVQPQTLRAKLRKLMKEYGWVAVGVYAGLSVLDLPLSFLIVRWAGVETIGNIEHYIVSTFAAVIPESVRQGAKDLWAKTWQAFKRTEKKELGTDQVSDKVQMVGWGVEEAEERNNQDASLATQLALAYAIHKSFIFIRVPLVAALTPKVVKVLRSWGWKIGKRPSRS